MRGGAGDLQPPPPPNGGRKKGGSGPKRPWLVLYSSGQAPTMENEKNIIMQRTGIRPSDLRILDPSLSYPSTILSREKAIVVNLEHIKAIITAEEVFLLNPKDPSVSPFVDTLQKRIMRHHQEDANMSGSGHSQMKYGPLVGKFFKGLYGSNMKVLPFEFVALEACIEFATTSLEDEVLSLELEAYPALDKLTSEISTLSLEQVRHIKTRLVAITGRVQRVKDELINILYDEEDMAEMYLTQKKLAQHRLDENSSSCSIVLEGDKDDKLPPGEEANRESHVTQASSSSTRSVMNNYKSKIKDLELILEVYFVKMDSALMKLMTLKVEVEDTEKYIKIMQDNKQNEVLQMSVKLTTVSLVMNAFIVVAGIFGMNIGIELFNDDKAGPSRFVWTVVGGSLGSVFCYFGVIGWSKHKRLL